MKFFRRLALALRWKRRELALPTFSQLTLALCLRRMRSMTTRSVLITYYIGGRMSAIHMDNQSEYYTTLTTQVIMAQILTYTIYIFIIE
jgi:hypothetical protein